MKKSLIIFLCISSIFISYESFSQCEESLDQAQEAFDNGHLYGIPGLLSDCVNKGSKQDKIEAYRLLTLTYLYIDDPIAAQNSFLSLLKLDPEYRVDSTNHIEIVHLSKEFITTPIVSWSASAGVNLSNTSTIHVNGPSNTDINNEKYLWATGGSIIGTLDVHFNKVISLKVDSDLSYSAFRYENFVFNKDTITQNSKDKIELHEKSLSYSLPISIKLTYPGKNFYPYIYGGYSPNYTFVTSVNGDFTNNQKAGSIDTKNDGLDIMSIREEFSHSAVVGIGLMRRINYNYVFIDIRYKIGLSNRLKREEQYNFEGNDDLNTYSLIYLQQDNDFRHNELTITAGYTWPRYKPRKRKSVSAKSFIGGIFKKKKKDE